MIKCLALIQMFGHLESQCGSYFHSVRNLTAELKLRTWFPNWIPVIDWKKPNMQHRKCKFLNLLCKSKGVRLSSIESFFRRYKIMLSCWSAIPENRPKFHELEKIISKLIGERKSQLYIDLNRPYLKANAKRFKSDRPDYLALLASPNCQAPPVPTNAMRF